MPHRRGAVVDGPSVVWQQRGVGDRLSGCLQRLPHPVFADGNDRRPCAVLDLSGGRGGFERITEAVCQTDDAGGIMHRTGVVDQVHRVVAIGDHVQRKRVLGNGVYFLFVDPLSRLTGSFNSCESLKGRCK